MVTGFNSHCMRLTGLTRIFARLLPCDHARTASGPSHPLNTTPDDRRAPDGRQRVKPNAGRGIVDGVVAGFVFLGAGVVLSGQSWLLPSRRPVTRSPHRLDIRNRSRERAMAGLKFIVGGPLSCTGGNLSVMFLAAARHRNEWIAGFSLYCLLL